MWPRTDGDRAGVLTVTQLEEAAWQLSSAEGARADRRFAVCFVVPAVPVDAEDNTGAVLADLEAELLEGQTAIARFSLSHDPVAQTNSDGFSYPAVMMVVRRVD